MVAVEEVGEFVGGGAEEGEGEARFVEGVGGGLWWGDGRCGFEGVGWWDGD